jgi:hypothetical protein
MASKRRKELYNAYSKEIDNATPSKNNFFGGSLKRNKRRSKSTRRRKRR